MTPVGKDVSSKISNMSLWCSVLVISIHCGWYTVEGRTAWLLDRIFAQGYSRIAVPFFFAASGYFLAGHADEESWWKAELGKRLKTILVPYVLWALIFELLQFLVAIYSRFMAGIPFGKTLSLLNGNALRIFGLQWDAYPMLYPFWYLRALFIYVLLSPLLVYAARRAPWIWLGLLFGLQWHMKFVSLPGGWPDFMAKFLSLQGLLYFSLGLHLRIAGVCFSSRRAAIFSLVAGFGLVAARTAMGFAGRGDALGLINFSVPLLLYGTWHYMPTGKLPKPLRGMAFPVFAIHVIVLSLWAVAANSLEIYGEATQIAAWPAAFLLSVLAANMMRRFCPRLSSVLFGGR